MYGWDKVNPNCLTSLSVCAVVQSSNINAMFADMIQKAVAKLRGSLEIQRIPISNDTNIFKIGFEVFESKLVGFRIVTCKSFI